jgi:hypothetical protein
MNAHCIGEFFDWVRAFESSLPLAAVFAAHVEVEGITELQCAARTGLDRKTVHRKKRALIETYRVLVPQAGSGRGWQGLPCRIDSERLRQLVANAAKCPKTDDQPAEKGQLIAQKGTIETPASVPKGTIEPVEKGQLIAQKGTIETPPYKERAPAPASSDLAANSQLASCSSEARRERNESSSSSSASVASTSLSERVRRRVNATELRFDGEKMDPGTAGVIAAALKPLPHEAWIEQGIAYLVKRCRHCAAKPGRAYSWGWAVTVTRSWVEGKLGDGEEPVEPSERKPPQAEPNAAQELNFQLAFLRDTEGESDPETVELRRFAQRRIEELGAGRLAKAVGA